MKIVFILISLLISVPSLAAPRLSREWARSTLQKPHYAFRYFNRMAPIITDKLVIQGNAIDGIKAFDRSSGHEKWSLNFKNGVEGGATTDGDKLYFGANNGLFYCVDVNTGSVVWTHPLNSESLAQPLVQGNLVFHITSNNIVYSFNKNTGQSMWIDSTNSVKSVMTVRGQTSPAYSKGILYVGFSDGNFAAYNAQTGRKIWNKRIGDDKKFNDVDATAKVTDKCVLISSYANSLYCLDKNSGSILWRHDEGAFNSVLVSDGKIFYPTGNGEIHILDGDSGKLLKKIIDLKGLSTEIVDFKDWIVYGESSGAIVLKNKKTLQTDQIFFSGRGLVARPVVDSKANEIYFLSNEANLFKLKLAQEKKVFPWSHRR